MTRACSAVGACGELASTASTSARSTMPAPSPRRPCAPRTIACSWASRSLVVNRPDRTMHVVAPEELRRGALDRRPPVPPARARPPTPSPPRAWRTCSACSVSPPAPASSHADAPRVGDLGRPRRSEHQRGELARTESVLGRPGTHDVTPRRGLDPVTLAPARVVRDRLTPGIPNLDAGRHQLALALLDLPTTRGELPQHAPGRAARSPPSRYAPDPNAPTEDAHAPPRAGAPGRGTRPPWRAGRSGWHQAPSTARQCRAPCSPPPHAYAAADPPRGSSCGDTPPPRTPPPPRGAPRRGRDAPDTPHAPDTPPPRPPPLVRLDQRPGQRRLADGKQHADRLRCRERQVKRRDLRTPANAFEALTCPRVTTFHQRHEPVVVNPASEPEGLGSVTGPPARATRPGRSSSHRGPARPGARNSATARPSTCRSTTPPPAPPRLRRPERRRPHRLSSGFQQPHTATNYRKSIRWCKCVGRLLALLNSRAFRLSYGSSGVVGTPDRASDELHHRASVSGSAK